MQTALEWLLKITLLLTPPSKYYSAKFWQAIKITKIERIVRETLTKFRILLHHVSDKEAIKGRNVFMVYGRVTR